METEMRFSSCELNDGFCAFQTLYKMLRAIVWTTWVLTYFYS